MQLRLNSWQLSVERVRPSGDELAARYDRLASRWQGKLRRLGYDRAYRRLFGWLEGALDGLHGESRVLDCGIGTGALSVALTEEFPALRRVHGVDFAPRMLAEARWNLAARGIRAELRREDVRELSLPSASFDLVMSAHTIEHLRDPGLAVREMARVLRPDAPLILLVTRRGWFTRWLTAHWHLQPATHGELRTWMVEAGLSDIRPVWLHGAPWLDRMSIAAIGWKR